MCVCVLLTVLFEVHAAERERPDPLLAQLPLVVNEQRRQVLIRVVRDADARDALEELGLGELRGEVLQVLVEQCAQRDTATEAWAW